MLLRPGLAEIERKHGRDAVVERGRYCRWISSASHRAEHDDAVRINVRPLEQQIAPAHQVPDHPFHQAFACKIELHPEGVARVVALPRPGLGLHPLARSELIHHQYGSAATGPRHAQLRLNLRRVMAVNHNNGGDPAGDLRRQIQIRGDHQSGPALENDVF